MEYSTGLELILNACESALQIAVTDNERLLCFQEWRKPGNATEILAPSLQHIFNQLEISPAGFRRIGCVAGPGSFTGIRLVLATAAAMRRASKARLAQLDYLQALATTAAINRGWLYPGKIFVITHARRDLVHFQEFISYGPAIPSQPVCEATLLEPLAALEKLPDATCLVCGSGIASHPGIFSLPVTGQGPLKAPKAILLPDLINPSCASLCLLGRHGDYFPKDVDPKYIRGCEAVEKLADLAKTDADAAKRLQALASLQSGDLP